MIRVLTVVLILCCVPGQRAGEFDRQGVLWEPIEWPLEAEVWKGNPFDVEARVTFVHESGERRRTGMFYNGHKAWKFRFTATRTGQWTFETESEVAELAGKRGTIFVGAQGARKHGFIRSMKGNKWAWQTAETETHPFVPQLVMGRDLDAYADPGQIQEDIRRWLVEHGFSGIHVAVLCRWFDFDEVSADQIESDDPNPDPRTFEVLEQLITEFHKAGGMVHLWMWGDESRRMTPAKWGINGKADQRLQRYIAARLGPLPGWTAGYGFDLWEWVDGRQLADWHANLHRHFGWTHLLGARWEKNELTQATEALDYSSYEQHQPDYAKYVETIEKRPGRPSFSEDRFRVREPSPYPDKDYDLERTRRGLWHSTMAGGVANIWGYLVPSAEEGGSRPYPNREQILTYAKFFEQRFVPGMKRENGLTDGVALVGQKEGKDLVVIYKENSSEIPVTLTRFSKGMRGVAVDATKPYREIPIMVPQEGIWKAPHASDWALALEGE